MIEKLYTAYHKPSQTEIKSGFLTSSFPLRQQPWRSASSTSGSWRALWSAQVHLIQRSQQGGSSLLALLVTDLMLGWGITHTTDVCSHDLAQSDVKHVVLYEFILLPASKCKCFHSHNASKCLCVLYEWFGPFVLNTFQCDITICITMILKHLEQTNHQSKLDWLIAANMTSDLMQVQHAWASVTPPGGSE